MAVATLAPTHETFLANVRDLVVERAWVNHAITDDEANRLRHAKLLYGTGGAGIRGACYYQAWQNGIGTVDVVEIGAMAQESWVQLTGTTIHELAHVLAGNTAGHDSSWKAACVRLGFLMRPAAAGQVYHLAMFHPVIRHAALRLAAELRDGNPAFGSSLFWMGVGLSPTTPRPCSAGIGTRGGKSRGKGSGSRLRLYECGCPKPIKVRVASDSFAAHCDLCEQPFRIVVK